MKNRHGFGRTAVLAALAAGLLVAPSLGADTGTRAGGVAEARCRRTRSNSRPPQVERLVLEQAGLVAPASTAPAIRSSFFGLQAAAAATPGVDGIVNDPTDDTPENTTQSETTTRRCSATRSAPATTTPVRGGFSGLSTLDRPRVDVERPGRASAGSRAIR